MLKKIDCVMIGVDDVAAGERFYSEVFGLTPLWREAGSVGMGFPETDAEIVLHNSAEIPNKVEVHYLVDNVVAAVKSYAEKGCRVLVPPFNVLIGKCAVIQDPFKTTICLLDLTSGRRPRYFSQGASGADLTGRFGDWVRDRDYDDESASRRTLPELSDE